MNQDIQNNVQNSMLKSHTSIVSIMCKEGVVMAADRRVTAGNLVVSKSEQKVQQINDYLVVAWTGSLSDAQLSGKVISAELRLKELKTKSRPSVKEAANLISTMFYRNIRTPSMIPSIVGLLVSGLNDDGSTEAYSIEPAGSVNQVKDYDANFSSGMPYILGLLERQYRKDLSIKDGVELAKECLKSSTQRDIGSGNGIDVFTITKDGIKHVVSEEILAEFK
jgi:proteasome beta subunit